MRKMKILLFFFLSLIALYQYKSQKRQKKYNNKARIIEDGRKSGGERSDGGGDALSVRNIPILEEFL